MPRTTNAREFPWHDRLERRSFLKGAAGTVAAVVVGTALQYDAVAQRVSALQGRRFFSAVDAETIGAIAERIWPETDDSPGAREAGVVTYIDHALAGPYASHQSAYRVGVRALDQAAQDRHDLPFRDLSSERQDTLLSDIAEGTEVLAPREGMEGEPPTDPEVASLGTPNLQEFFELVRTHTMEGLFADPIYGGNQGFAGWRAVGYPGPYYLYTAEEQQTFEALNKPFQSVADL